MTDIRIYFIVCFSLFYFFDRSNAMTIDQRISEAATTSTEFDLFYDESRGLLKVELDMLVTLDDWKLMHQQENNDRVSRKKRKAVRDLKYRWTNHTVPYEFQPGVFGTRDLEIIQNSIKEWENFTCLNFRPAKCSDKNKLKFIRGKGCYSSVGMRASVQVLSLGYGCIWHAIIVHEIGHAIGFIHEHERPDRDGYVTIMWQNIKHGRQGSFKEISYKYINTYGVKYDYLSIMHYGQRFFSKNGKITIKTKSPYYQDHIGKAAMMSYRDVKLANIMYSCAAVSGCAKKSCPGEGFLGKDCKCWCPGSPVQYCDGSGDVHPVHVNGSAVDDKADSDEFLEVDSEVCRNMNSHCDAWARAGECETNPIYMKTFCKPACNACDIGDSNRCEDMDKRCGSWEAKGYCEKWFKSYVTANCRKTCGVCFPDKANNVASHNLKSSQYIILSEDKKKPVKPTTAPPSKSSSLSAGFLSVTTSLMLFCLMKV